MYFWSAMKNFESPMAGRDPVDHVQDADHHDQDPGEQDPVRGV